MSLRGVHEWTPFPFSSFGFFWGPHVQSIWGPLFRGGLRIPWRRERWGTPDGDFLDIDFVEPRRPEAPTLLLLHGLEGSSNSHYIRGMAAKASTLGWRIAALNFRSCSGELNRMPRFYHSAETEDINFVVCRLVSRMEGALLIAGFSLGGNILLKWLGEKGEEVHPSVCGAAVVSAPFVPGECAKEIDRPTRAIYRRPLLSSAREKFLKLALRHPGIMDTERVRRARTFVEFDRWATAPVHGYADEREYYEAAISLGDIPKIRVPALILSARDDPIVPERFYPTKIINESPWLRGLFLLSGGHVGFVGGKNPANPEYWGEGCVLSFLSACLRGAK